MAYDQTVKVDISTFLTLAREIPVIDVRSPLEFNSGHIPGAFNIPLLNDREREAVGIMFKKAGRIDAILTGLQQAGPSLHLKLREAMRISDGRSRLLVHCWRGGMRSEAMAWLFSQGGINPDILDGGYKSYRHHVLEQLSCFRDMIILGGLTGSGKTQILGFLKENGHQVIDLEGLANHKGSAFGSLGQKSQPTSEHFANLLFDRLKETDPGKPVWLEDESRNIGTVFIHEGFYRNMQNNPAVIIKMDIKTRLPRLIREYSGYPPDVLISTIKKISKRLGGDRAREAVEAVSQGDFAKAIETTLQYYDKTYLFGLGKKPGHNVYFVDTDTDDIEINSFRILEAAKRIRK